MSWICSCRHQLLGEGLKLFISPAPPQILKTLVMVEVGKVIVSFLFLTISLNLPMTCPGVMLWVDFVWMSGTHMPLLSPPSQLGRAGWVENRIEKTSWVKIKTVE